MRLCLYAVGVAALSGSLLATRANAQDSSTYFHFDVGPNILQDIHQEFADGFERDLEHNTGVRANIAQGFNLCPWSAIDLETGFSYNELKGSNDWMGQVPLLASLILKYDASCGWTPFVGIGGGGSITMVNSAFLDNDNDLDLVFAWQGQAGLRYRVGPDFGVGVVYKYFGTSSPEFELFGSDFEFENIHNHYVGLQLHYDF
jgi:OmpA-OmpF porin, OOP family